jgi:hypothetical protein
MNSTKKAARVAGALYVRNSVPGFVRLPYVPGKRIVSGNAPLPGLRSRHFQVCDDSDGRGIADEVLAFD